MSIPSVKPLARQDLAHVLQFAGADLEKLRGAQLFLTGGTGFFGKWLVPTFLHANRELQLGASLTVLTRDPGRFRAECPHLAADLALVLQPGDVRTFDFPTGKFSHVIHGASGGTGSPLAIFDTIVEGTRRTLDFAASSGVQRFLFLSSGAVYGTQPSELTHIPETYLGAPDPLQVNSEYGEGKRAAELLCCAGSALHGFEFVSARCFAFSGPYLPLDGGFAIGNFMRDALAGGLISVQGDGTPYRSYLFAADLSAWLWTLLVRGENGRAYNVGSDEDVNIATLAQLVAEAAGKKCGVQIAGVPQPGIAPARYVPSIDRARAELGLEIRIKLREGIQRTLKWLQGP